MFIGRRTLLGVFIFAAGSPRSLMAQSSQECFLSGDVEGWRISITLPRGDKLAETSGGGSTYAVVPGLGEITIKRQAPLSASPGQTLPSIELIGQPGQPPVIALGDWAPWFREDWTGEIRFDGDVIYRRGNRAFERDLGKPLDEHEEIGGTQLPLDQPFPADTVEIVLISPDESVTERFSVPLDKARAAWNEAEAMLDRALAGAPERCSSDCTMTHAAVGLLGRNDDCFELRQMRALRAAYPEHADVVVTYRVLSRQILGLQSRNLRNALTFGFYGTGVWPAALLMRLGARRAAMYWYLGAFALLCRLVGFQRSGPVNPF